MKGLLFFIALSLFSVTAISDQTVISEYYKSSSADDDAFHIFWGQVYPNGGWTIYCGQYFANREGLQIEHVYPAIWIVDYLVKQNISSNAR